MNEREELRGRLPLTRIQRLLLDWLTEFIKLHHYAPTYQEIADHFGYRSLATVHEHLESLRHKGWIRVERYASRGITIKPPVSPIPEPVRQLALTVLEWQPDLASYDELIDVSRELAKAVRAL